MANQHNANQYMALIEHKFFSAYTVDREETQLGNKNDKGRDRVFWRSMLLLINTLLINMWPINRK
jgi:hypothetical protein